MTTKNKLILRNVILKKNVFEVNLPSPLIDDYDKRKFIVDTENDRVFIINDNELQLIQIGLVYKQEKLVKCQFNDSRIYAMKAMIHKAFSKQDWEPYFYQINQFNTYISFHDNFINILS